MDLLIFAQSYSELLVAARRIPKGTYSYFLGVTWSCSEPRVAPQQGPTHLCWELLEVTWSCSELRVAPLQGHVIFARSYSEKLCCCQLLSLQPAQPAPPFSPLLGKKVPNHSHSKCTHQDCLQSQNIQGGKFCKSRTNALKKLLCTRLRKLVSPSSE